MVYKLIIWSILPLILQAEDQTFDYSVFNDLLARNVSQEGEVDYTAFINNSDFDSYLKSLATAEIDGMSADDRLAFYINAYNALVIKNIIDHWPLDSPMKVDGFFKMKRFTVAGEILSLDEIEYRRVFPLDSILVHFGLVCAARSCPDLVPSVYSGKTVRERLTENAERYFRQNENNRLDKENRVLYLSKLLQWFKTVFESEYGSLLQMAKRFMKDSDSKFLEKNPVTMKFLEYNWQLNSR